MKNKNLIIGIMLIAAIFLMSISSDAAEVTKYRDDNGTWVIYIQQEPDYFPGAIEVEPPPTFADKAKELIETYAPENPYQTIQISDAEFEELRWVLALEAQGEGYTGEVACLEAIFNRCLSEKDWGGTVHGVLSKKGQFATYKYIGSRKAWCVPGEMEDDVISEVLRTGLTVLPSYRYVYFDSRGGVNGKERIKIGGHTFGRE